MPGLAVREFKCSLCQKPFTMLSGDLILPGPNICDDCLREVWELEGEVLVKHVAECSGLQSEEKALVNSIMQHIHRKCKSARFVPIGKLWVTVLGWVWRSRRYRRIRSSGSKYLLNNSG
jgi:hypothetical protein